MILNSSSAPWSHVRESDDSEDEETSPTEEFWPIPEDGWTLVERSHGKTRGNSGGYKGRNHNSGGKLDNVGLRYDELDDIIDTKVLSNYRKEVVRITDTFPKTTTDIGTVIVDVKPIVKKQPDRLEVESIDRTDGQDNCLVNMVLTPRERERQYSGIRTRAGELLPESREGIPNEMTEEVTTGGLADGCEVVTKTTAMKAITKDDVIIRPVPRLLSIEVVEETRRNENTFEEYTDGHLVKDETTKLSVSTELVDLSQKLITRGFLELAEEARIVDVRLTPSCCMNEIIQQITETTEPMGRDISWKIEEVMEQSVDYFCDVAMKVPTAKFDIGQLMQWPDVNPAGMMICEFKLDSEMFFHGPVRREAEPVFVAAESEVFTQVFTGEGGGVVAETGPLVVAEAVTSRVSALPTVGSDIQTVLSAAVGGEDRCSLSLSDYLDKVGHVAGRSEARTVPVEHLLLFSTVHNVMLSWMRPLVARTSKFFLSDEREEVEMPLYVNDDRPVRARRVYIGDVDTGSQMTKETHGVGPTGDRWDGLGIITDYGYLVYVVHMEEHPAMGYITVIRREPLFKRFGR